MDIEAEVTALEVAEVLAEVPKSPRPKPNPTKEAEKDKKGRQPAIPVRALPSRNPPNPTT